MNLADCKAEFRVEKSDLPGLADALHIPAVFYCKQRGIWDGMEGLCVPTATNKVSLQIQRYDSTLPTPVSVLRLIRNEVMDFIHDNHAIS